MRRLFATADLVIYADNKDDAAGWLAYKLRAVDDYYKRPDFIRTEVQSHHIRYLISNLEDVTDSSVVETVICFNSNLRTDLITMLPAGLEILGTIGNDKFLVLKGSYKSLHYELTRQGSSQVIMCVANQKDISKMQKYKPV